MFGNRPKVTATVEVFLNGNKVRINPSHFTIQEGDNVQISYDIDLPFIQRENTVGDVRIERVVQRIVPEVEAP